MQLIAITGGIGAGKSLIVRLLHDRGAHVIDADQTARRVVDPSGEQGRQVLARIRDLLGAEVISDDGSLDRDVVASRIFDDLDLRLAYNAIIHPAIMQATAEEIDAYRELAGLVVHEIPLLTADTPPLPWSYDLIITVEADAAERARRLQSERGYSADHAATRIAAQGSEERRVAIADVVLRTDGALTDTVQRIDELWQWLTG